MNEDEVKEHVLFLSDRGANIKYRLINAGFIRLTCYAHIIHNLVSHMLSEKRVKEIIQQCSVLSSYVKNSGMNKHLKTSLKRHTPTRWNSVFMMVEAIINNYQDIYEALIVKQRWRNEYNIKNGKQPDNELSELLTVLNRKELEELMTFLEPFKVEYISTTNLVFLTICYYKIWNWY